MRCSFMPFILELYIYLTHTSTDRAYIKYPWETKYYSIQMCLFWKWLDHFSLRGQDFQAKRIALLFALQLRTAWIPYLVQRCKINRKELNHSPPIFNGQWGKRRAGNVLSYYDTELSTVIYNNPKLIICWQHFPLFIYFISPSFTEKEFHTKETENFL